jgi:hypothetical protein
MEGTSDMSLARVYGASAPTVLRGIALVVLPALCLLAVWQQAVPADLADEMQSKLEGFVEREGTVTFLALYWIPQSQQEFMAVVGDLTWWSIASVQEFEDVLSRQHKREIVKQVAGRLARLPADEREGYFRRLGRWVVTYHQLNLMDSFVSCDLLLEAIISLPATRPVYDSVVASRSVDPSLVTPEWIVETMASGERTDTWFEGITLLSSFGDAELMLYFRDLYSKLEELSRSGGEY